MLNFTNELCIFEEFYWVIMGKGRMLEFWEGERGQASRLIMLRPPVHQMGVQEEALYQIQRDDGQTRLGTADRSQRNRALMNFNFRIIDTVAHPKK